MNKNEIATGRQRFLAKRAEIMSKNIPVFLEVRIDEATKMRASVKDGEIKLNGVIVEDTSDECFKIIFKDDNGFIVEVELRWCHRWLPIASCNCAKGVEHIRCEHLVHTLLAYLVMLDSKIAEQITKNSQFVWIPYHVQKT